MKIRIHKAKKALFVILSLLMAGFNGNAQSGKLTVENYTDFDVEVVMHGYSPQTCTTGTCSSTYITNTISVPRGAYSTSSAVWGPYNPCDIVSSPGWNTVSCGVSFCSSVPGDFQWTYAEVTCINPGTSTPATYWNLSGTWPLYVCPIQPSCSPALGPTSGPHPVFGTPPPPHPLTVYWLSSGGSLADVKIYVYEAP